MFSTHLRYDTVGDLDVKNPPLEPLPSLRPKSGGSMGLSIRQ